MVAVHDEMNYIYCIVAEHNKIQLNPFRIGSDVLETPNHTTVFFSSIKNNIVKVLKLRRTKSTWKANYYSWVNTSSIFWQNRLLTRSTNDWWKINWEHDQWRVEETSVHLVVLEIKVCYDLYWFRDWLDSYRISNSIPAGSSNSKYNEKIYWISWWN